MPGTDAILLGFWAEAAHLGRGVPADRGPCWAGCNDCPQAPPLQECAECAGGMQAAVLLGLSGGVASIPPRAAQRSSIHGLSRAPPAVHMWCWLSAAQTESQAGVFCRAGYCHYLSSMLCETLSSLLLSPLSTCPQAAGLAWAGAATSLSLPEFSSFQGSNAGSCAPAPFLQQLPHRWSGSARSAGGLHAPHSWHTGAGLLGNEAVHPGCSPSASAPCSHMVMNLPPTLEARGAGASSHSFGPSVSVAYIQKLTAGILLPGVL